MSSAAAAPECADDNLPLSPAQESIWMFEQLLGDGRSPHQLPFGAVLTGPLDIAALRRALNEVLDRHDALRARFRVQFGAPTQEVARKGDAFSLAFHDLSHHAELAAQEAEARCVHDELERPFDLASGPLARGILVRRSVDEHLLLLNVHHIAADGWSMGILLREISFLYSATVTNSSLQLPPIATSYIDYARSQHTAKDLATDASLCKFWERRLQNAPALIQLPTDRPRPPIQSCLCDVLQVDFSRELALGIRALAAREQVSVFTVMMTGWALLLWRLSGDTDLVIGTATANRIGPDQLGQVGMYAATPPVRVQLIAEQDLASLLKIVHRTLFAVLARQNLPFKRLIELLRPTRSLSHAPIFQVGLTLFNVPKGGNLKLAGMDVSALKLPRTRSPYDLMLALTDDSELLDGRIEFSKDLFDRSTVERIHEHLIAVLTSLISDPSREAGNVQILSPTQHRELLKFSWGADRPLQGPRTMHEVFEEHARCSPNEIALEHDGEKLSYGELNAKANQLAVHLTSIGAGGQQRVAICIDRSPLMVIAVFGVLKAGSAFIPLDASYPLDRLAFMLEDIEPVAVIVDKLGLSCLPSTESTVINLDNLATSHAISLCPTNNLDSSEICGTTPAYIIYTSGSTGKPKGAINHHAGLRNIVESQRAIYSLGPHSRILQVASFSFDVSLFEMMMALCNGGTLCLARKPDLLPVEPLVRTLVDRRITLVTLPPSALSYMPLGRLPNSLAINVTGENFPPVLGKAWAARHKVFNAYGPTETAIWSCTFDLSHGYSNASIPIGRPLPNEQIYVLDDRKTLCPIGVAGEVFIGGVPVGSGYFRREALTAERFVTDPIIGSGRLYRTGDIARWLPDGNLQFLGRRDSQVKLRGFRVELGEIEALLGDIDGVREAAVLYDDTDHAMPRLIAYLAVQPGYSRLTSEVRDALRDFLPDFMMPSEFVIVSELPVTPNGKVDRKALLQTRAASNPDSPLEVDAAISGSYAAEVLGLYRQLLRQPTLTLDTDFFACGGHSLMAVQLVVRLRERLGVELPVREVFANPIAVDFATVVAKYADAASATNLTLLRAGRSSKAVYFVHAIDGEVGYAYRLLPHLPTSHSIFSLSASGLVEGESPIASVVDMAERYVAAMRTVSRNGPFNIIGWSAGGTIAYEMARQVLQLGLQVGLLVMLDTHCRYTPLVDPSMLSEAIMPSAVLGAWLLELRGRGMSDEALARLDLMTLEDAVLVCQEEGLLPREFGTAALLRWWEVRRSTARAVYDYSPVKLDSEVMLVTAQEERRPDRSLGWQEILGDRITITSVPGTHHSMVEMPNATHLSDLISSRLILH